MGAPEKGIVGAEQPAAETLLDAFKTISAAERRKHANVLNYWLSIRGDKEFPPLHDLDPLELSDAGPNSILLELISGGHDAEVRHLGEALRGEGKVDRIIDAPNPSILSCIAKKLPLVAISRDYLSFEDEYSVAEGKTRCWVTLLPLSAGGAWVDYVYALVTFDGEGAKARKAADTGEAEPEHIEEPSAPSSKRAKAKQGVEVAAEEPSDVAPEADAPESDAMAADAATADAKAGPGFSKLFESLAGLSGFYGTRGVKAEAVLNAPAKDAEGPVAGPIEQAEPEIHDEPAVEDVEAATVAENETAAQDEFEPAAEQAFEEAEPEAQERPAAEEIEQAAEEQPATQEAAEPMDELELVEGVAELSTKQPMEERADDPAPVSEGPLETKLAEVRAKADEARMAKLKANVALYDGLSAAYDFALDAEDAPEEYLKLVEAQGLKIQLRSPMKPVVKLAFAGLCDDSTIKQLEAILAWALDNELPRGSLAEQIEAAGGIGPILNGAAKDA